MAGGDKKNIWIVANWKSNKTIEEALEWVSKVGPRIEQRENIKVVVCPSFVSLEEVKHSVKVGNFPLMVGSQDISAFDEGPYTGEEAARQLKGLADIAIIGHSERRKNFGESNDLIVQKVKQAQNQGITPLLCVQDENTPLAEEITLVAYEPIFAIGTGNPDTPENASKVASLLKQKKPSLEVLYGGSVTSENSNNFLGQEDINGLLIGGASLDAEEFLKIIEGAQRI